MLFSELTGKVIVSIDDGEVVGTVAAADLLIDEATGAIVSLLLPAGHSLIRSERQETAIPWENVVKIGPEIVFVRAVPGGARL
ncbi:MAG: YlmC/YmxH family sporulation protein [Bacillota bacterium]|jgi:YlmC/YmxH family sporulation protein